MNKMYKNHKLVLVTELICFHNTHSCSYWNQYPVSLRNMACHRSKMSSEYHFMWKFHEV